MSGSLSLIAPLHIVYSPKQTESYKYVQYLRPGKSFGRNAQTNTPDQNAHLPPQASAYALKLFVSACVFVYL